MTPEQEMIQSIKKQLAHGIVPNMAEATFLIELAEEAASIKQSPGPRPEVRHVRIAHPLT